MGKIGEKPDWHLVKLNYSWRLKVTVIKLYAVACLFQVIWRFILQNFIIPLHLYWSVKISFCCVERNCNRYISSHNFHVSRERSLVILYCFLQLIDYCIKVHYLYLHAKKREKKKCKIRLWTVLTINFVKLDHQTDSYLFMFIFCGQLVWSHQKCVSYFFTPLLGNDPNHISCQIYLTVIDQYTVITMGHLNLYSSRLLVVMNFNDGDTVCLYQVNTLLMICI